MSSKVIIETDSAANSTVAAPFWVDGNEDLLRVKKSERNLSAWVLSRRLTEEIKDALDSDKTHPVIWYGYPFDAILAQMVLYALEDEYKVRLGALEDKHSGGKIALDDFVDTATSLTRQYAQVESEALEAQCPA